MCYYISSSVLPEGLQQSNILLRFVISVGEIHLDTLTRFSGRVFLDEMIQGTAGGDDVEIIRVLQTKIPGSDVVLLYEKNHWLSGVFVLQFLTKLGQLLSLSPISEN